MTIKLMVDCATAQALIHDVPFCTWKATAYIGRVHVDYDLGSTL